jgi:hypothetical protein
MTANLVHIETAHVGDGDYAAKVFGHYAFVNEQGAHSGGQLWERIAESKPTSPRIKALARRVAIEAKQQRPMTHGGPGMSVVDAQRRRLYGASGSGGVIIAGHRVR